MQNIGIQEEGSSPAFTKRMAMEAYKYACQQRSVVRLADVGCGRGELSTLLSQQSQDLTMMDSYKPPVLPPGGKFIQANLNDDWPIATNSIDMAFAVEVIEHVENPRHFMREFSRILIPGGLGYLSTPNNHSIMSKLTFLLKGEHRLFQDPCYPAHITALMECDFLRIFQECGLHSMRYFYSNEDTLPLLHFPIKMSGRAFSVSWGLLFQKRN